MFIINQAFSLLVYYKNRKHYLKFYISNTGDHREREKFILTTSRQSQPLQFSTTIQPADRIHIEWEKIAPIIFKQFLTNKNTEALFSF